MRTQSNIVTSAHTAVRAPWEEYIGGAKSAEPYGSAGSSNTTHRFGHPRHACRSRVVKCAKSAESSIGLSVRDTSGGTRNAYSAVIVPMDRVADGQQAQDKAKARQIAHSI